MNHLLLVCALGTALAGAVDAETYSNRWVWVFGWNLNKESDVADISSVLDKAASHGLNGAVLSCNLDTLCKKTRTFSERFEAVKESAAHNKLEVIPAVYGVGYGGTGLAHNKQLAEGLPVEDAPFVAKGNRAEFLPDNSVSFTNGGFEEFTGNKFKGYRFHDQPGVVTFADTEIKHSGRASMRLENFTANPHGHGRVMQEIAVKKHRSYRITGWIKTEALEPVRGFALQVLAEKRSLAPKDFRLEATGDWQKLTMVFNSLGFERVRLYAGIWGGKSGKFWLDDFSIEEVGPLNVLHRGGTPVTVKNEDGSVTFTEGTDYAPLIDPSYSPNRVDRPAPALKLLPGSRIRDGQRLKVSWYHSMAINDGQVTVCMAEPELYEIFDHEAKLLAELLHPRHVLLNMDEIRMGGTCQACRGRNMGELLGECITKQVAILRKHMPGVEVLIWSDMLDPNHNAHGDYYLVEGDFTGSWRHVPKDMVMAVWGGKPREKSMQFFANEGFRVLASCYYDADNLDSVKGWLDLARPMKNVNGFMYTPWQKKYSLLPEFGDLLKQNGPAKDAK